VSRAVSTLFNGATQGAKASKVFVKACLQWRSLQRYRRQKTQETEVSFSFICSLGNGAINIVFNVVTPKALKQVQLWLRAVFIDVTSSVIADKNANRTITAIIAVSQ